MLASGLFSAPLVIRSRHDAEIVGIVVLWRHDAELTGVVTGSRYDTEVVRVMIIRRQDTLHTMVCFGFFSHYNLLS